MNLGRLRPERRPASAPNRNGEAVALRIRERLGDPRQRELVEPRAWWRQPLPLIGIALVLVALLGYLAIYNGAGRRSGVLIATRNVAAGSALRPEDIRVGQLAGDQATLAALIPGNQLTRVLGRTVQVGVAAGSPIAAGILGRPARSPAAFTLVVPVLHALGGRLQPGDHVTVLATYDQTGTQPRAQAIARDLLVVSVGSPPSTFDSSNATVPVTVLLPDPSLAGALALANSDAKIDLLRDGSQNTNAPIPAATEATP